MSTGGRASGVQLHITSLPGGRLGEDARRFVDWLAAAGQSYWQILPLGPPDRYGSPYKPRSAFACWGSLLERPRAPVGPGEEGDFRERQRFWIGDWERAAGGRRAVLDQVRFEREWQALRAYAQDRGVSIIGDMPLYVAPAGVDHRSRPELFARGLVAGAPPDRFAPAGQLWGNPVYDWPALRRRGYRWWVERQRRASELFDLVRIDHFRGLVAYWAVPAGARTAAHGSWRRGPGGAPLRAAERELGRLEVLVEDLGVITPPVERLRRSLALPGMAVLQFLFDGAVVGTDPVAEVEKDRVLYTATHDQDTLVGWWQGLESRERDAVNAALHGRGLRAPRDPDPWPLIALAASSPASITMVQMQDVLSLGSQARMNSPGRATGNWRWRMAPDALSARLARRLRQVAAEAGRAAG
ncbi:MAG TPA: 4-alpha-glucanotransferase [Solirubrobacteraceae bacterium]|nr:4-alpha-glucanotransferase [Solirubrobacteraceae bacterium]